MQNSPSLITRALAAHQTRESAREFERRAAIEAAQKLRTQRALEAQSRAVKRAREVLGVELNAREILVEFDRFDDTVKATTFRVEDLEFEATHHFFREGSWAVNLSLASPGGVAPFTPIENLADLGAALAARENGKEAKS